jgi:hypothetical protein
MDLAGWDPIPLTPDQARLFGLPAADQGYRRLVHDGALVALTAHSDNGYALAITHLTRDFAEGVVVPGRLPTLLDVYAARRVLIPEGPLMVCCLEPMSYALRLRWARTPGAQDESPPPAPGLPTTVKVVQMYCEGITEDAVFGTEDIPSPTPVLPLPSTPPPSHPLAAFSDELFDVEDEDEPDDDDGRW